MNRRDFLASAGVAAIASTIPRTAFPSPGKAVHGARAPTHVDFTTDGLGLGPRDYTALLQDLTARDALTPDGYSNGGVIQAIEQTFARMLGKQAAMFVPTGTLANHIAVRTLAKGGRVLVQDRSHFYNDSGDAPQVLSGLNLMPVDMDDAALDVGRIEHALAQSSSGRVRTPVGAISIETPVRRRDHALVDFDVLAKISALARERGIGLHLDGARLFNMPFHSGRSVKQYAALFDTVYVSLWKNFNGASGAILAGDAVVIDGLFHVRRMFGGSLPQAWPIVAPALHGAERYESDYANAWKSADRVLALLQADGRFAVRKVANGTSRFFLKVTGIATDRYAAAARTRDLILPNAGPDTDEFALQVNPTWLRMQPDVLARRLIAALG